MSVTVVNRRTAGPVPNGTVRIYIGRPSPLGNPFVIGRDGTREEVIRKFDNNLISCTPDTNTAWKEIHGIKQLAKTHNIELECWCAPLPCHGDIIKELIES